MYAGISVCLNVYVCVCVCVCVYSRTRVCVWEGADAA